MNLWCIGLPKHPSARAKEVATSEEVERQVVAEPRLLLQYVDKGRTALAHVVTPAVAAASEVSFQKLTTRSSRPHVTEDHQTLA